MIEMTQIDREERIRIELKNIGQEMAGINPILQTWSILKDKQQELNNRLNEMRT